MSEIGYSIEQAREIARLKEELKIKTQNLEMALAVAETMTKEVERLNQFELTCDGWRDKAETYERNYYRIEEENSALREKVEKAKVWKLEYGGKRTEYIEWYELEQILTEK